MGRHRMRKHGAVRQHKMSVWELMGFSWGDSWQPHIQKATIQRRKEKHLKLIDELFSRAPQNSDLFLLHRSSKDPIPLGFDARLIPKE